LNNKFGELKERYDAIQQKMADKHVHLTLDKTHPLKRTDLEEFNNMVKDMKIYEERIYTLEQTLADKEGQMDRMAEELDRLRTESKVDVR